MRVYWFFVCLRFVCFFCFCSAKFAAVAYMRRSSRRLSVCVLVSDEWKHVIILLAWQLYGNWVSIEAYACNRNNKLSFTDFCHSDEIVIPWNVTITFHYRHSVAGLTIVYIQFYEFQYANEERGGFCFARARTILNACKSGGLVRDVKIISAANTNY